MQDQSRLQPADIELVNAASNHAKERFQKGFISIAGALSTEDGKTYTGINLKYRVRNESTCGETMAIYSALNDGVKDFDTVVGVKYYPDTDSFKVVNGCGWCRQLFAYNMPLKVIIDKDGILEKVSADELLPYAFM